jgi:hypothetical protein
MRKLLLAVLLVPLLVSGFALWPLVSAFQIKQAVKAGDVATLERKVDWVPVRQSLKASIAVLPAATASAGAEAEPRTGFSLWRLVKAAATPMLADSFIDKYVTPEGISQIQQARRGGWRALLGLAPKVPDAGVANAAVSGALLASDSAVLDEEANVVTKFLAFYQRLVSARFISLSQVEFEIADRTAPARRYVSQFVLKDFDWKLASVRIVGMGF